MNRLELVKQLKEENEKIDKEYEESKEIETKRLESKVMEFVKTNEENFKLLKELNYCGGFYVEDYSIKINDKLRLYNESIYDEELVFGFYKNQDGSKRLCYSEKLGITNEHNEKASLSNLREFVRLIDKFNEKINNAIDDRIMQYNSAIEIKKKYIEEIKSNN